MLERAFKENGIAQRGDTVLTKAVASTLVEKMRKTGKVHENVRENPLIELFIKDEHGEVIPFPVYIKYGTYTRWIERRNVVPETGEVLADLIDAAREEWEAKQRKQQQKELIVEATNIIKKIEQLDEQALRPRKVITHEVKANGSWEGKKREVIEENGVPLAATLRLQFDAAKYTLDRLDADFDPKKKEGGGMASTFSLVELRRAARAAGMDA